MIAVGDHMPTTKPGSGKGPVPGHAHVSLRLAFGGTVPPPNCIMPPKRRIGNRQLQQIFVTSPAPKMCAFGHSMFCGLTSLPLPGCDCAIAISCESCLTTNN